MEHAFWQERWRENRIAFHEPEANPNLIQYFEVLQLSPGQSVFVPLCGKSFDLDWLLARELRVVGAELNQCAVEEVFERLNLAPEITDVGSLKRYNAAHLALYVGDFFELDAKELGPVQAVYDRAALVAMPETMRADYARHLMAITGSVRQLLIAYDYDQNLMNGPPFAVPREKIDANYAEQFAITALSDEVIGGPLASRVSGREQVWLLS